MWDKWKKNKNWRGGGGDKTQSDPSRAPKKKKKEKAPKKKRECRGKGRKGGKLTGANKQPKKRVAKRHL